jgi:tetratricopeptide (TPR) repeat protein
MRETISAILDFYWRPLAAPSRAMDACSLLWAAVPAILLCLISGFTGPAPQQPNRVPQFPHRNFQPVSQQSVPGDEEDVPPPAQRRWQDRLPIVTPGFRSLLALAVVFVPSAIFIWVMWWAPGGFSTILMRDYAPTLLCLLLAWTAAYLPVFVIRAVLGSARPELIFTAGFIYFAFLAACSLRTVMGIGMGAAVAVSAGAYFVSYLGLIVFSLFGNVVYYLASPWFLFYFYRQFQSGAAQLGSGLSSRQNLSRSLATSTLNPRDGDAHYQLGLIYVSRRQFTEAINRFQKAVEIDPKDAGPRYELGRIALYQQRYQDAFDHFYVAAELDPSHALSAVWRDIGIACWYLGDYENARAALERYIARREYDPEGLYWFGKALASTGQRDRAADVWRQAVNAAKTTPSNRRRLMMKWAGKANSELKAVGEKTA